MFSNLIESGSHRRDLKRRGTFFLGTLVTYGVLLVAAGVGSIYAYNATIEDRDDYEVLAIMDFSRAREERAETVVKKSAAAASKASGGPQKAQPVAVIEHYVVQNPNRNMAVAPEGARVLPPGMRFKFGEHTNIPTAANIGGDGEEGDGKPGGGGGKDTGPLVEEKAGEGPPAMKKAEPAPMPKPEAKKIVALSSGVITSKAVSKPAPPYPATAKMAGVQGPVTVQIVVDEQGRVVSSKATGGHPLLRQAAEQAAYKARFTPTLLGGQPVKVTGMMTYNFVLN